jgi:molybdopterin synthase catalytic subunit
MKGRFALSRDALETAALARALAAEAAGALVTFEGWVRVTGGSGAEIPRPVAVTALEYEAWDERAVAQGELVLDEATRFYRVLAAACVHRVGRLAVGDIAVWIGVTAVHREAAFDACRYIIDEVKERVPIWKKEHFADGSSAWAGAPGGRTTAVRATGGSRAGGAGGGAADIDRGQGTIRSRGR